MSNTTSTIIVASSALSREDIASLLQGRRFKVTTAVDNSGELANHERDLLVRSLELILMGQQIFVLSCSIGALANGGDDVQFPELALGSQSASSYEFGKRTDGIQLSHRERQVLISLAHGESNKGIARAYDISEATVKVHLRAILRKTKMRNRTQAAIWAIEHGLADARQCDPQPLASCTVGRAEGKSATDKSAPWRTAS